MDSTIIAAIIGATGTVIASVITILATSRKHGPSRESLTQPPSTTGLTFDQALHQIQAQHPHAVMGATASYRPYFERAKHLTNFRLHTSSPMAFAATQSNGKTMWLYLGTGGKICCGDKQ